VAAFAWNRWQLSAECALEGGTLAVWTTNAAGALVFKAADAPVVRSGRTGAKVDYSPERDRVIAEAYASGGYTIQEISDCFGLHYSSVSKIVRAEAQARRQA